MAALSFRSLRLLVTDLSAGEPFVFSKPVKHCSAEKNLHSGPSIPEQELPTRKNYRTSLGTTVLTDRVV